VVSRRIYLALFGFIVLSFFFTGCTQEPDGIFTPWEYTDLRGYDPVDSLHSTQDLIAIYSRTSGNKLQIRLDLLEHGTLPDYDLYLVLDYMPGGRKDLPIQADSVLEWDTLLIIPASGKFMVLDSKLNPSYGMSLYVQRDSFLDALTININLEGLSTPILDITKNTRFLIQAFLTPVGSSILSDQADPISTTSLPPPRVKVLFAFWNTYPAYTPATALRRWSGAHTGPMGGSHGLSNLLSAARSANIPLVLLDLRFLASLSALDFLGNLSLIKDMEEQGLLILPEYLPDLFLNSELTPAAHLDNILEYGRSISQDFDLPPNPYVSAPSGLFSYRDKANILFSRDYSVKRSAENLQPTIPRHLLEKTIIPILINHNQGQQATLEGPALEVKQALIKSALLGTENPLSSETPVFILGGDLPSSTWGISPIARATFKYLENHPWIQILTDDDILSLSPGLHQGESHNTEIEQDIEDINLPVSPYQPVISVETNEALLSKLDNCRTEDNPFDDSLHSLCDAAWQAYLALFAPVYPAPPELPALRANYVGQVWSLLEAHQWAESPTIISTCEADPDRDGQSECILSTRDLYTQFEIESGSLTYAFSKNGITNGSDHVHQVVAPSSQFITGLSEPSSWNLSDGLSSDTTVIIGGFAEEGFNYQVDLEGEKLFFTSLEKQVQKTFQLTSTGLHVDYILSSDIPVITTEIPLFLDPWKRFSQSWAEQYHQHALPNGGWVWQLDNDLAVQVQTTASLSTTTFMDSIQFLSQAENPNQDYPHGHFLTFPLSLIEIHAMEDFTVKIDIMPVTYHE